MYDVLESTNSLNEAENALRVLMFEEKAPSEAITTSLNSINDRYDVSNLIDSAATKELPILYTSHRRNKISMPKVLHSWKGDFREDTNDIYKIAKEEVQDKEVKKYQQKMRSKLPSKLPLVRGSDRNKYKNNRVLRSWTASVGLARLYGDNLHYTVVNPSDVFMCSMYGEKIGEQEFTLKNCNVLNTYSSNTRSHVKIYQKMHNTLS